MGRIWTIARREYLERVRSKVFLFTTLLAPVIFSLIIILPLWLAARTRPSAEYTRITIIDASGSELGQRIATELNGGIMGDTSRTHVVPTTPVSLAASESTAAHSARRGLTRGYLVLDSATLSDLSARYVGTNATSEVDVGQLRRVLQDQVMALRLERAGADPLQIRSIINGDVTLHTERLGERGRGVSQRVSGIFAFGIACLLYISILLYGQNVMRSVIEEKQSRVAELVVASVPATKLLAGKVLGVGAVGITQLVLSAAASVAILRLRSLVLPHFGMAVPPIPFPHVDPGVLALLFLYFLLGYLFYAALFAAVGALVSTEHDAQTVQLPVAMLLIFSALFIEPVLLSPESDLARILGIIPFSAPVLMPLRLSLIAVSPTDILLSVVALTAGSYITVWIGARIYRTGLLMYGKRPTVREIVRWIRYAP